MPQKVPSSAKIVVVGGGIIGCSIAYHLAKLGFEDVVLLERKTLTSGTTWHAAGLLAQVRPSENQTRLLEYAAQLYKNIEAETGQSAGFVGKGTIYLALNEARLHFLKQTIGYAHYLGVSGAKMLTPPEIAERWPLLNLDGVIGGSFLPSTGQLNPVDATQAFSKGARMSGASIIEHANVQDIIIRNGAVAGVETEHGAIEAPIVVLAGGMWTRDLVAKYGINIPLHAAEHFYIVSDPIPGLSQATPTLFCTDERAYYKEDAGKLLIGTFEKHAVPWATEGIPPNSEYETLPNDLDRYAEFLEMASCRVPTLDKVGIRTFFTGPESFTPDGRELMGETPEVRNLYVCAGFNSHGIMAAPGSGKVMAEWIRDRSPPMALSGYDVTRVMPFQRARRYLFERTKESMGYVMDIPWPGKLMQSGRGVRRFPMHRELIAAGAVVGERYGWEAPLWYAPKGGQFSYKLGRQDWHAQVQEECLATRDSVVLYDQSNYSRFLVQGRDACRALNYLCANDVDVEPGRVVYSQWLNERGGIEADITATRLAADRYILTSAPPSMVRDVYWFRKHVPSEWNVTIADVTAGYAMFGIMGPKSREMLQQLTDADLSNEAFPFATSREIDLGFAIVRATRLTYVGELGYELLVSADMAAYVYETLVQAGAAYDMRHAGSYALGACRLERAYRHFGHDITEDYSPIEAGLSFAVAWQKPGDFLGRKSLEMRRGRGAPQRRLVTVQIEDKSEDAPILAHNEVIWRNGERVGYITSGGWGFRVSASLGMGYVKNPSGVSLAWIESGKYEIEAALRKYPAKVQLKPFYDPNGDRIKM
ncbi:GcvT family protein [Undibacter mobilis]|uniref:GcvT family protein n=1 Tax=Undibacter mobilis TaxID=2292256 RepID=UPI001FE19504|nr:FAD-dependent oxidoreductase [Undibacter mobilis]